MLRVVGLLAVTIAVVDLHASRANLEIILLLTAVSASGVDLGLGGDCVLILHIE